MATNQFAVWDYLVFALVLAVSAGIGIYYGCTGGKQKTTGEFLMANRQMSVLPVTLSLLASFMSAITLLGTPAEMYQYGTVYWWIWLGYGFVIPLAAHFFLPVFFRLKLTSVYEYLEMRFNSKSVRICAAITFIIQMSLYMAIVLYAPSLALNQVTNLNVWISVVSVGLVCTFYTTIGGMKAVMWTDSFQICMMFAGLIAVLVKGSIDNDGFGNVWRINQEGGRINFEDWDFNPLRRHTFWTCVVGGCFTWLAVYGTNQAQVQRSLCLPSLRQAQIALWLNFPLLTILLTVCSLCGLVIYAEYKDCDPLTTGEVGASDQLLPFYVIQKLAYVPGLPGLFTACLFSAALSTISSGLNSLAAVTLQDIIMNIPRWENLSDTRGAILSKVLACCYGLVCLALTVVAAQLGDVLQAALGLFGMIGGPLLGLFFLGMAFPFANWIGALAGLFSGLIMTFWVGIGAQIYKHPNPKLNMSIAGCPVPNITDFTTMSYMTTFAGTTEMIPEAEPARDLVYDWYALSYLHYGTLAVIVVLVVGSVVSLATGSYKKEDLHPRFLQPLSDVFCCCCSQETLRWCRCHVDKLNEEEEEEEEAVENGEAYYPDEEKSIDTKPIQNQPSGDNNIFNGVVNPGYNTTEKPRHPEDTTQL